MKKLFAISFFLCSFLGAYSQTKTSLEDYTYITVALSEDIKTGRGIKHGYSIENIGGDAVTVAGGTVMNVSISYFKKGDDKVAVVVAVANPATGNSKVWCIPAAGSDKEVWERAKQSFQNASMAWNTALIHGLTKVISLKIL